MKAFIGLMRREIWEHPALFVGPLGANLFVALSMLIAVARGIGSRENLTAIAESLDLADESALEMGRNLLFASPAALVVVVTVAVGYFYFLDCLYAERKERSILFFKSFPVTDTQTVLAKVCCGVIVLPALSLVAFAVTQLLVLVVATVALLAVGGGAGALWDAGSLFANWIFVFYVLVSSALWYSAVSAYLLLVSAWAKKAVYLWSLAPLFAMQAELLLPGENHLGRLIIGHIGGYPAAAYTMPPGFGHGEITGGFDASNLNLLSLCDPVGLVMEPALWVSLALAGAFVSGAIALRRYRDDS